MFLVCYKKRNKKITLLIKQQNFPFNSSFYLNNITYNK